MVKAQHEPLHRVRRTASGLFDGLRPGMTEIQMLNRLYANEGKRLVAANIAVVGGADPLDVQIEIEKGLGLPVTDPTRK